MLWFKYIPTHDLKLIPMCECKETGWYNRMKALPLKKASRSSDGARGGPAILNEMDMAENKNSILLVISWYNL